MKDLTFDNVSLRYHALSGETHAVKDFTLTAKNGEFIAIVGPSGCGKSTLLHMAAGLLKPDSGEVRLGGDKITAPMDEIGYMLQKDHLFQWLTIEKNAQIGLKVKGKVTPERVKRVNSLLKSCGLGDFLGHYPSQLSGGMRQRAALVRTLALEPDVLLLDEPFSALDYQTRVSVAEDVFEMIKNNGITAVLVTHDIIEACSMADRVVVMTGRPGTVKAVHDIDMAGTPIQRRSNARINDYFESLWKELDIHGK